MGMFHPVIVLPTFAFSVT